MSVAVRVHVPLDRDGYLRRTCPACGFEFKLPAPPSDLGDPFELGVRRVMPNNIDANGPREERCCPYCGTRAVAQEFTPQNVVEQMRTVAFAEAALPILSDLSRSIEQIFGRNRGGLIQLRAEMSVPERPRAFFAPEAPDGLVVRLACCNETLKIVTAWRGTLVCPACGAVTVLQ